MPTSADSPGTTSLPKISTTQISPQSSGCSSNPHSQSAAIERGEIVIRQLISR